MRNDSDKQRISTYCNDLTQGGLGNDIYDGEER